MRKQSHIVKDTWAKVNARQRRFPLPDGTTDARVVPMYVNPTGDHPTFCFKVPDHVREALDCSHINNATAKGAEQDWEVLVDRYCTHIKTAVAEPVIIVKIDTTVNDSAYREDCGDHRHAVERRVQLSYTLAFRVHDHYFFRRLDSVPTHPNAGWGEPGYGARMDKERIGGKMRWAEGEVLPYTPELHRRIDAIAATLKIAAHALGDLNDTKDLAGAIMALPADQLLLAAEPGASHGPPVVKRVKRRSV